MRHQVIIQERAGKYIVEETNDSYMAEELAFNCNAIEKRYNTGNEVFINRFWEDGELADTLSIEDLKIMLGR